MKKTKINRNKVAIVTGGAVGLGKEIVNVLVQNEFKVAIIYNKSHNDAIKLKKDLNSSGSLTEIFKADITKHSEIKKAINSIYSRFKSIDVLINNSSIIEEMRLENITEKLWDKIIDTNLKGTFFTSQAAAEYMFRQGGGQIINISSLGGIIPFKNYIPYSVSKAGVIMLTKCLAKSLAPKILVNSVAPGTIGSESRSHIKKLKHEKNLLNKYATAKDITGLVLFLAEKNNHITGQTFLVDGGRSIM
jgi:NAD(P)-dependent dehydrogenase (short-subunit alcohol dehydrogenase family)